MPQREGAPLLRRRVEAGLDQLRRAQQRARLVLRLLPFAVGGRVGTMPPPACT